MTHPIMGPTYRIVVEKPASQHTASSLLSYPLQLSSQEELAGDTGESPEELMESGRVLIHAHKSGDVVLPVGRGRAWKWWPP